MERTLADAQKERYTREFRQELISYIAERINDIDRAMLDAFNDDYYWLSAKRNALVEICEKIRSI